MVRLNITMPEDLVAQLKSVRNKSQFIAQALREKLKREKTKQMEQLMIEGYKKMNQEDRQLIKDWDSTANDGIE